MMDVYKYKTEGWNATTSKVESIARRMTCLTNEHQTLKSYLIGYWKETNRVQVECKIR